MFRVSLAAATIVVSAFSSSVPAQAIEVYMFKGAGDFSFINENMHFSRGLNKMSDQLNAEGIRSEVRRFEAVGEALSQIRKRKPESIAIIGHSMGALASMSLARSLKGSGVRIAYMGLIDIPGPVGRAGENVEWAENYYSLPPVYGLLTNASTHPKAKNIHISGYMHNRMDDSPKLQKGMMSAIRKIHAEEQNGGVPTFDAPAAEPLIVDAAPVIENRPSQEIASQTVPVVPADVAQPARSQQAAPQTLNAQARAFANPPRQASTPVITQQPVALPQPDGGQIVDPSVDPWAEHRQTSYAPVPSQPIGSAGIDPTTTASVEQPGLIDRGRALIGRAGSYLQSIRIGGGSSPQKREELGGR